MRKPAMEVSDGSVVILDSPHVNMCHGILKKIDGIMTFIPTGDRSTDLYRRGPIKDTARYTEPGVARYGPRIRYDVTVVVERPDRGR